MLPFARRQQFDTLWRALCRVQHPVCEDLREWCDAHISIRYQILTPSQVIRRRLPSTIEPEILEIFRKTTLPSVKERLIVQLPNTRVLGKNGLVVLPDGSFVAEAIYDRSYLVLDPSYSVPLRPRVEKKAGEYYSLLGEFSNTNNYYHWIHDGLLRLYDVATRVPPNVKYLVPSSLATRNYEMLGMIGLHDEQIVRFPSERVWELEVLYFASLPPSGADLVAADKWLRDAMLRSCGISDTVKCKRLYLSRRFDDHARVLNDLEVTRCLSSYGFETCYPARLPFRDQVALFSQAEVIISGTSSGLTNMLFAPEGTKILEFLEPIWAEEKGYVLWSMSEALGHEYWYLLSESVPNPQRHDRADLVVPLDKLTRTLEQMQVQQ